MRLVAAHAPTADHAHITERISRRKQI